MSKWIPVSERLPEDEQTVLCYWPAQDSPIWSHEVLTFCAKDAPDSHELWRDFAGLYEDTPTHWMPLPEPPK